MLVLVASWLCWFSCAMSEMSMLQQDIVASGPLVSGFFCFSSVSQFACLSFLLKPLHLLIEDAKWWREQRQRKLWEGGVGEPSCRSEEWQATYSGLCSSVQVHGRTDDQMWQRKLTATVTEDSRLIKKAAYG